MNRTDVGARLRDLPPALPEQIDRFNQVQQRVRRRRARRLAGSVVVAVAVITVLVPVAVRLQSGGTDEPPGDIATDPTTEQAVLPSPDAVLPGADRIVVLSTPRTHQGTGTVAVNLGERPAGATAVSMDLSCLTAGTFQWPDGASLVCDESDAVNADDPPVSPGYVVRLRPGQSEVVVKAGRNASWQIVTSYVRVEHTNWATNARGETYGTENGKGAPDLIAIGGPDGETVYGRRTDLNEAGPRNPEEAGLWMKNGQVYAIPTYATDGTTIVGTFGFSEAIGPGAPEDEDETHGILLVNGAPPPGGTETSASGRLTVTNDGCVHLDTETGTRWLILPWGVHLSGTPADGLLQTLDGALIGELNTDVTFTGAELPNQVVRTSCATGLPPLYGTESRD